MISLTLTIIHVILMNVLTLEITRKIRIQIHRACAHQPDTDEKDGVTNAMRWQHGSGASQQKLQRKRGGKKKAKLQSNGETPAAELLCRMRHQASTFVVGQADRQRRLHKNCSNQKSSPSSSIARYNWGPDPNLRRMPIPWNFSRICCFKFNL